MLMRVQFKVKETEYERGFGQRVEYLYFDTKEAALAYVEKVNSVNTAAYAPDVYGEAEYVGIVEG